MAKTTIENLKLGIFVVLGTLLLLFASYLIGNRQNMFTRNFELAALFQDAKGLQKGNDVRFAGISVGTVNRIEMVSDSSIYIGMIIEEKMRDHIKKDAIAMIGSDGLVGSMLINIVPGQGTEIPVSEGDTLQTYSQQATRDMLSTLSVTNENAALLTADLLQVTRALVEGDGVLGRLLHDASMAEDLRAGIADLRIASNQATASVFRLQGMMDEVEMEKNLAGVFLKDTVSAQNLRQFTANLEVASDEINQLTRDLRSIVNGINQDQGVVAFLAKDTLLAASITRTLGNLEEGTGRFNENMEALKHNFLTRGYFRKQERERKRLERKMDKEDAVFIPD